MSEIPNYLANDGYALLRSPGADVQPLTLVFEDDDVRYRDVGDLGELFVVSDPPTELPSVTHDVPFADLGGHNARNVDASLAVSLLGAFIGAVGGSDLGLDAKFSKASTADFAFQGPLQDSVSWVATDRYLHSVKPDTVPAEMNQHLNDDKLSVVTAILKSNKFAITTKDESGQSVELDVPEIKGVISGGVEVHAASDRASTVTFEGKTPLTFAYQALVMRYEGEQLMVLEPMHADAVEPMSDGDLDKIANGQLVTPELAVEFKEGARSGSANGG
jgi:hypothetical protein